MATRLRSPTIARGRRSVLAVGAVAVVVTSIAAVVCPRASAQLPAPIAVAAPVDGGVLPGFRVDRRRLRASVELVGTAQPGSLLSVVGACGSVDCEGLTYADRAGRWRTVLDLTTPRARRRIAVRVSYWPNGAVGSVGRTRVRLAVTAPPPVTATFSPALAPDATRRPLLLVGDSLGIGAARALIDALPEWSVAVDAAVGRRLDEGMGVFGAAQLSSQTVAAFSLFTNDDPDSLDALERAVRESVARLGPHGCAIWATISRRAVHKVSYRAANARLLALAQDPPLAGRLLVVPWAEEVARHHEWKQRDHVHATAAGNLARARMYADAARACTA
jgi:hypothetical protein